jgi:hypothetical protein
VRDWYFVKASVARRMRVVPVMSISTTPSSFLCLAANAPVSTIPAVVDRMVVVPYWMDSSIPQKLFEGETVVMGLSNLKFKE